MDSSKAYSLRYPTTPPHTPSTTEIPKDQFGMDIAGFTRNGMIGHKSKHHPAGVITRRLSLKPG